LRRLQAHGIAATAGLLEERARRINEPFIKYIAEGLPFVTLKTAMTLDGRIATKTGHSRWVTGPESREAVHTLRHRHQAIMIGRETAQRDDPQLTTRLDVPGRNPIRIVVDSQLRLPETLRLFDGEAPTWIIAAQDASEASEARLRAAGAEVIRCGDAGRGRVDLAAAMRELGKREIGSILLDVLGPEGMIDPESGGANDGGWADFLHRYAQGTMTYGGSVEVFRTIIANLDLQLPRIEFPGSRTFLPAGTARS